MHLWSVSFFHVYNIRNINCGAKQQPDYGSIKLADKPSHIYFTMQSCGEVHNASNFKKHCNKAPNHNQHTKMQMKDKMLGNPKYRRLVKRIKKIVNL